MIVPQGWEDSKHKGTAGTEKFNAGDSNLFEDREKGDAQASPFYFYLL
jgi:hypothetical protein